MTGEGGRGVDIKRKRTIVLDWETPNAFKNKHRPNLQLEVINSSTFSPCFKLRAQEMNVKILSKERRTDSQGGWCAWERLSTLQLRIYVPERNFLPSRSVTVVTLNDRGQALI